MAHDSNTNGNHDARGRFTAGNKAGARCARLRWAVLPCTFGAEYGRGALDHGTRPVAVHPGMHRLLAGAALSEGAPLRTGY